MKRVQLLLLFLIAAALAGAGDVGAMVIRGDALWREQPSCPEGWQQPDFDDSTWAPVEFPWIRLWPYEWPLDAEARPFWGTAFHGINCVRRRFDLPQGPPLSAPLHIWVDDDYELFVNGVFVGASLDGTAARPGESYDVAAQLRRGGNVVAIRLRDTSGVMAALVSLTLSGVAEPRRGWREHARAWLPYGKAAAVVVAAVVWLLITRQIGHWCRRRAVDADAVDADSWAAAALAIALLCEGLLASLTLYSGQTAIPDLQWHWLSLALVMLALSLLWAAAAPCRWPAPVPASQQHRWLVIAIVALAAVLRIVWLDSIPTGFFQDEATNGNDALELATKEWRLWSESVGGRPTLFLYAMLPVLHLFGTNYLTLKVLPVTIGIATVAAVYWLGRVAFGSRMALWAAFLLAVSRWHIHYSRLAWEAICVPLFAAAGFALLLQGLARQGRAAALRVGAGAVLLGLGLYTYAAYRAAIAVAIVFGASVLLLRSESGRRIEQATAKIGLAGTVGLLVALPLILFAVRQPELYWHRYHDVSLTSFMAYYDTPMPWLHQIGRSLLSLNNAGDELIRHNLPGAAHL
ncbi:MAG TPA: hypothetical protein VEB21_16020, partial [Terriglobales bacterium]|nr:hypothetical protein [Terriglobales bacterium]